MITALGFVVLIALAVLGFGLVSKRLETSVITPPMVFVTIGLLLGPDVLQLLEPEAQREIFHLVAELTLVLVLFTDASRIRFDVLRKDFAIPLRLLALGLPLMILFGSLAAMGLFPGFGWLGAAVLAVVLAPTDAALGQAVVSNPRVPTRIRQALNVESGLNDGIAVPLITILLAIAAMETGSDPGYWLRFTAMQLVLGPLVGAAVGYLGGQLISRCSARGWMSEEFRQLGAVSLALIAYGAASLVGGNGFIASFVAGLTVGNTTRETDDDLLGFAETEGQLLSLVTFLLFGAVMASPALVSATPQAIGYAVLSLTVLRVGSVALATMGLRLRPMSVLFLGWFGPRGLASVLFAILVVDSPGLLAGEEIYTIAGLTILLSVFAHGLSAVPAANAYARRTERMGEKPAMADMPELRPGVDLPVRLPYDER